MTFHTGMSTAYPQPEPAKPPDRGRQSTGRPIAQRVGHEQYRGRQQPSKLTITDNTLAAQAVSAPTIF